MTLRIGLFLMEWWWLLKRFDNLPGTIGRLGPLVLGALGLRTPWYLGAARAAVVVALVLSGRAWERSGRKGIRAGRLYLSRVAGPAFKLEVASAGVGDVEPEGYVVRVMDQAGQPIWTGRFELAWGGVPVGQRPTVRRGLPAEVDLVYPQPTPGQFAFPAIVNPPGRRVFTVQPGDSIYFLLSVAFPESQAPIERWCVVRHDPASSVSVTFETPPWERSFRAWAKRFFRLN